MTEERIKAYREAADIVCSECDLSGFHCDYCAVRNNVKNINTRHRKFETTQSDLTKYNGTIVKILHPLNPSDYDEEYVGKMYRIVFEDGIMGDAFEDELEEVK